MMSQSQSVPFFFFIFTFLLAAVSSFASRAKQIK